MAKSLTITLSNRSIGSVSISNRAIGSVTLVDVVGESGTDTDAQTWIDAGSFSAGNQTTLNTFVTNLKTGLTHSSNIWAKAIGLYVWCWGSDASAANNAINGKNPGTFDLTFVNSPTHGANGITTALTNYARTGIVPSTSTTLNDVAISIYRTGDEGGNNCLAGVNDGNLLQLIELSGTNIGLDAYNNSGGRVSGVSTSSGLITGSRRSSTDAEIYNGASSIATVSTGGGSRPALEIYFFARNNNGSANLVTANTYRVGLVSSGLTDNEVTDWNAAVTQLFTDLGI